MVMRLLTVGGAIFLTAAAIFLLVNPAFFVPGYLLGFAVVLICFVGMFFLTGPPASARLYNFFSRVNIHSQLGIVIILSFLISLLPAGFIYFEIGAEPETRLMAGLIIIVFISVFTVIQLWGSALMYPVEKIKEGLKKATRGVYHNSFGLDGSDEFSRIEENYKKFIDKAYQHKIMSGALQKYVPTPVTSRLSSRGEKFDTSVVEEKLTTIMFADIRNFTELSQNYPPEELINYLNDYMRIVVEEIQATDGIIDKFIGDAVLGLWGEDNFSWQPDSPEKDFTRRAIRTAVNIQKRVFDFNERQSSDHPRLAFGIGICTGKIIMGHLGTHNRADWTALGEDVNVSQRISDSALPYRVLISSKTYLSADQSFETTKLDSLSLKGLEDDMELHSIRWYKGRTGPLLVEKEMKDGWYFQVDSEARGPFNLYDLTTHKQFEIHSKVKHELIDGWKPWYRAAEDLRIWTVKTAERILGVYKFRGVRLLKRDLGEEISILVRGDNQWRDYDFYAHLLN